LINQHSKDKSTLRISILLSGSVLPRVRAEDFTALAGVITAAADHLQAF